MQGSEIRLFVGNLPKETCEKDLFTAFSTFGEITKIDLKLKTTLDEVRPSFAFVTLFSSPEKVESCINYFSEQKFKDTEIYVTRARESFLEKLERERKHHMKTLHLKEKESHGHSAPVKDPVINLSKTLNPRKRKEDTKRNEFDKNEINSSKKITKIQKIAPIKEHPAEKGDKKSHEAFDIKKQQADLKRVESLKKKREEFKQKQNMIKTSLLKIDENKNKRIFFSDHGDLNEKLISVNNVKKTENKTKKKKQLLDDGDDDSDDHINFNVKKQYEGKQGQKVLDLQSRYKSDTRFMLDERFIEQEDAKEEKCEPDEEVELGAKDEKDKQLDILQQVLGVEIKRHFQDDTNMKKTKSKLGMLRFDPSQPDHAKFLAPVDEKEEKIKKPKKLKKEANEDAKPETKPQPPAPEVSKEQFYKVSEALKEAIVQPTTFSLRSLFGNNEEESKKDDIEQDTGFIPLEKHKDQKKKLKNPLDHGEKNPFVYDSSDSEDEEKEKEAQSTQDPPAEAPEVKAVWKENLFFSKSDFRFKEGLEFFCNTNNEVHKERRELKSLMKKRIYNKERKNQMFQKKIGGKKKTMRKGFRKPK